MDISTYLTLAKEYGLSTATAIALAFFCIKLNNSTINAKDENIANLKDQIDRLAAENHSYRVTFLRDLKGVSESELDKIAPGYKKLPDSNSKKSEENK